MRKLVFIIICLGSLFPVALMAQDYLYEAGVSLGIGSAYGDINQQRLLYDPKPAVTITYRYNPNLRWSFSGELLTTGLGGDSKDFKQVFPNQEHLFFSRQCWQLGGNAEFNFFNYGIGYAYRNTRRFTPFLSAGVAAGMVTGDGRTDFACSLPLGGGVRYKPAPRWNALVKFVFAKMLTDAADGVQDPYEIESSFWKNTDWYSVLTIGVTYEFGRRKRKCNNLE